MSNSSKENVCILTAGVAPIPPVLGGAIENRINYLIDYNEKNYICNLTILSIYNKEAIEIYKQSGYKHCKIKFIKISKIEKKINKIRAFLSYRFPQLGVFKNVFYKKMLNHLNRHEYDCVLIENIPEILIKKLNVKKTYLHLGNDVLNSETYNSNNIVEHTTGILTVSNYIRDRVLSINSVNKNKIVVVPQGTNIEAFSHPQFTRQTVRNRLKIKESDFAFVFCGRLHYTKGILEALTAFCEADLENCKFVIIGAKSLWDSTDEFTEKLRRIAIKCPDKIIFSGYVSHDEIPSYYTACDVAVLTPIWQEAGGNTIVESVVAGLPLITTDSGGNRDYCSEQCAIILPIDDNLIANIKDSMIKLYNNRPLVSKMALEAKKFGSHFSKEIHAESVFNAIKAQNNEN